MVNGKGKSDGPLFVFAGGGTGGHLYPALAIVQALKHLNPSARFLFMATDRGVDAHILGGAGIPFVAQSLRSWGSKPWRWPAALAALQRARRDGRARFAAERPALVVGSGGQACVPAMLEAQRMGIPTVVMNPDAVPGRANRMVARRARAVFVQWDESKPHFPSAVPVLVRGCPVRDAFLNPLREDGVARFGLDPRRKTLLITGASLGARSINEAVVANLPWLRMLEDWQVLHLTGEQDFPLVQTAYRDGGAAMRVLPYTEHMGEALAVADLVVARAGASFLAELTAVGRAAVLLPYPYHRDQHQLANARCLAASSAARILPDAIDVSRNAPALKEVLQVMMNDDVQRQAMADAARRMGRPEAAVSIAKDLQSMVERKDAVVSETMEVFC